MTDLGYFSSVDNYRLRSRIRHRERLCKESVEYVEMLNITSPRTLKPSESVIRRKAGDCFGKASVDNRKTLAVCGLSVSYQKPFKVYLCGVENRRHANGIAVVVKLLQHSIERVAPIENAIQNGKAEVATCHKYTERA